MSGGKEEWRSGGMARAEERRVGGMDDWMVGKDEKSGGAEEWQRLGRKEGSRAKDQ